MTGDVGALRDELAAAAATKGLLDVAVVERLSVGPDRGRFLLGDGAGLAAPVMRTAAAADGLAGTLRARLAGRSVTSSSSPSSMKASSSLTFLPRRAVGFLALEARPPSHSGDTTNTHAEASSQMRAK